MTTIALPTSNDALQEVVQRLVEAASPEMIILFGSLARGLGTPESDADLLVIESGSFGAERSRLEEISRLENAVGRIPISTDILVYSRQEVERWKHSPNHVIAAALKEGSILYERH